MNIQEYIKMVLVRKKLSERQLALLVGDSPQNFNQKIKGDMKWSFIESVANALGCETRVEFVDKVTGKKVL